MKYIFSILTIILLLTACAGEQEAPYPTDLAGKKALFKEKKKELRELQKIVDKLEGEIETLDPSKEKPRKVVTTQTLERKDFNRYVDIQATVVGDDLVGASSEMGGRIINMNLKEGDYIQKGSLVATLDMEAVDKQIAEIQKSLELANEVYERQGRLWKQNIGSEMQYLQAKNNKERLEKSLETVRFQTSKANVYAPMSGVVDMVIAGAGEMTSPGMPIVQILNLSKVKVVADLPEIYLGSIKRGQMVNINFPALEMEKRGRVSLIGRTINPANRTFKVEVNMPNTGGKLKPNLLATMLISDFSAKNAITVPLELVQQEVSGKSYLYVHTEGDNGAYAKKTYITTGEAYEDQVLVTEGLTGDENIISAGARGLTDMELIQINNPVAAQ